MANGEACAIPSADWSALEGSFDDIVKRLGRDATWVRFFGVRPCCPAPGAHFAKQYIAEFHQRVDAMSDFSEEQRQELNQMADDRLAWYISTFLKGRG